MTSASFCGIASGFLFNVSITVSSSPEANLATEFEASNASDADLVLPTPAVKAGLLTNGHRFHKGLKIRSMLPYLWRIL